MLSPDRIRKMQAARKNVKRRTRREKLAAYAATFRAQRQEFPRMALPIMMCLDCSAWQKSEVRNCAIVRCPLFPYRPYQPTQDSSQPSKEAP